MSERSKFFKKLRDEHYTILCPDMLPIHFELISAYLRTRGYNIKVLEVKGRAAKDEGLKAIHNDACYPAIIVAGQFINELKTGKYDLNRTAVIMSQTGGGCRASNYISLFRKAFADVFPTVPVLSINFSGLEAARSIPLDLPFIVNAVAAIQYADLIMALENQTLPYEKEIGTIKAIRKKVMDKISAQAGHASFHHLKKNLRMILEEYRPYIPKGERKPRVGIVGEIYVKYSPYANNYLADFLVREGCEVVLPSFSEFVLYCIYNILEDHRRYGIGSPIYAFLAKKLYRYYLGKTRELNKLIAEIGATPYEDFEEIIEQGKRVIDLGVKMGEGWVIPAEMLTYYQHGVSNIVCAQPFGCLPNHIVGKGMVRPLKEIAPDINIVPLDFDASSSEVNQENRLKLMLANLK